MNIQPHPTRWRFALIVLGCGLVSLTLGFIGQRSPHRTWWHLAAAPFAIVAVGSIPLWNYTRCPTCGARLSRARRTSDFRCDNCETVWTCADHSN